MSTSQEHFDEAAWNAEMDALLGTSAPVKGAAKPAPEPTFEEIIEQGRALGINPDHDPTCPIDRAHRLSQAPAWQRPFIWVQDRLDAYALGIYAQRNGVSMPAPAAKTEPFDREVFLAECRKHFTDQGIDPERDLPFSNFGKRWDEIRAAEAHGEAAYKAALFRLEREAAEARGEEFKLRAVR